MKIKNNVEKIMLKLGFGRIEFAKLLDITTTTLCLYNQQKRHPAARTCIKIIKLAKKHGLVLTSKDIRTL